MKTLELITSLERLPIIEQKLQSSTIWRVTPFKTKEDPEVWRTEALGVENHRLKRCI